MENNLEFEIRDFGPIDDGKIKIKPLTLLIGPNGSGKSYAAMLIQSVFESYMRSAKDVPIFINSIFNNAFDKGFANTYLNKFSDISEQIEEFKHKGQIPIESTDVLINNIFEVLYENRLSQELIYAFSSQLDDLIQIGKGHFEIKNTIGPYSAYLIYEKGNKLTLKEHTSIDVNVEEEQRKRIISQLKEIDKINVPLLPSLALLELVFAGTAIFSLKTSKFLPTSCYYLPAARSGIIQVRKKILTDEYKQNPYFDKNQIQQLSGSVSSFIYNIHNLPEEKGQLYNLARDLENELINGEIVKSIQEDHIYPDIKYKYLDSEIPLHRASSTVSELTPIILYLKYIIKKGDLLIIEEPEAHLHPRNQLILAKYLVRLIRNGVNLIITTHSDYLLQKLNNFMLLSEIDPQKRSGMSNHNIQDYLLSQEVGAYVFEESENKLYKIRELIVTKEDGISDEEFSTVVKSLYEETIELKEGIDSKECSQ
jgi:predicted ATPase